MNDIMEILRGMLMMIESIDLDVFRGHCDSGKKGRMYNRQRTRLIGRNLRRSTKPYIERYICECRIGAPTIPRFQALNSPVGFLSLPLKLISPELVRPVRRFLVDYFCNLSCWGITPNTEFSLWNPPRPGPEPGFQSCPRNWK